MVKLVCSQCWIIKKGPMSCTPLSVKSVVTVNISYIEGYETPFCTVSIIVTAFRTRYDNLMQQVPVSHETNPNLLCVDFDDDTKFYLIFDIHLIINKIVI